MKREMERKRENNAKIMVWLQSATEVAVNEKASIVTTILLNCVMEYAGISAHTHT